MDIPKKIKTELFNDNFQNEIWKDIAGYKGIYQVSNLGNVKSLDREITQFCHKNYFTREMKGRIIKPSLQNNGYELVWLSKNGKVKPFTVHRLVMTAFTDNSNLELDVNHIDGNKRNNRIDNLEWCNRSENIKHSYKNPQRKNGGKKVRCIELNIIFDSAKQASGILKINVGSIKHVTNGIAHTAGGYTWEKI